MKISPSSPLALGWALIGTLPPRQRPRLCDVMEAGARALPRSLGLDRMRLEHLDQPATFPEPPQRVRSLAFLRASLDRGKHVALMLRCGEMPWEGTPLMEILGSKKLGGYLLYSYNPISRLYMIESPDKRMFPLTSDELDMAWFRPGLVAVQGNPPRGVQRFFRRTDYLQSKYGRQELQV